MRMLAALAGAVVLVAAPAVAQSLPAAAPGWARDLLEADASSVTGGRASLADAGADLAVRVTIAPIDGGVARIVRYEAKDGEATLALRRFTGHPADGWWLWGPDTPSVRRVSGDDQAELTRLTRTALGLGRAAGERGGSCPGGETAFVEISQGGAAFTATRACVRDDPVSALIERLSAMGGSRTPPELAHAAQQELMQADRDFAAMARERGAPAAFAAFMGPEARMFTPGQEPLEGAAGLQTRFEDWPASARLLWEPLGARVSTRGDMGWTWGDGLFIDADGVRFTSRYLTVWGRDFDGNWRWVADIGVRGSPEPTPLLVERAGDRR